MCSWHLRGFFCLTEGGLEVSRLAVIADNGGEI